MVILYNCSVSLGLGSTPPLLPAAIQTSPVIKWPGHGSSWLRCRGKRLRPPVPRKPGEVKQSPALWAWGSRGGRKASLEATVASGVQQLACSLLWGRRESQAAGSWRSRGCWKRGPDYCVVWVELNASISASTSASERHLWEQNHRKRKKPAGRKQVSGRREGATWGLTQSPGTSAVGVSWASLKPRSNSQSPSLLQARRGRA